MLPSFYGVQGMPTQYSARILLLSGFLILSPEVCRAQTRGEQPRPQDGGVQERLVSILIPPIPRAPFTGPSSPQSVRKLAYGSRITIGNTRALTPESLGR